MRVYDPEVSRDSEKDDAADALDEGASLARPYGSHGRINGAGIG